VAGTDFRALREEIRSRVDIVDLVSQFVPLKRTAGTNWKGLCPFHAEKTPSFNVNPSKGIFHCFGCGVGGDIFGFLMRQERLTFPEALRALARRAGIDLADAPAGAGAGEREGLYRAMERAAAFYAEMLWSAAGARAREYLTGRGIDVEVARRFGLGYAPESWDALLGVLSHHGFSPALLEAAGLVVPRQGGGHYDRFRGRLIFPIRDRQGQTVAFGGRSLGADQPKYLNSPETPLYSKGSMLFALDLAREAIRGRGRALLVEGYVDCLMAHQHGFTETVAALGTAFTPAQLGLLRRHTGEVVTFFDADAAGQKAAERAEALLEPSPDGLAWAVTRTGGFGDPQSLRIRVALLPAGHDPDTLLRTHGADAFTQCIAAARGLLSYALDRVIADSGDPARPVGRTTAFARVARMLAKVSDAEEALALSREAALRLGVDATQLWIEAQRLPSARPAPVPGPVPAGPGGGAPVWERELLSLLLAAPATRPGLLPLVEPTDISHDGLRAVLAALKERPEATAESLLADLAGDTERGLLTGLVMEDPRFDDPHLIARQFTNRFEVKQRLRRIREVSRDIAEGQASGAASPDRLHSELSRLQQAGREARSLTVRKPPIAEKDARPPGPQGVYSNG
jgi:DNA primase